MNEQAVIHDVSRHTRWLVRLQFVLIPLAVLAVLYLTVRLRPLLDEYARLQSQIRVDSARVDSLQAQSAGLMADLERSRMQKDSLDTLSVRLRHDINALVTWKDTLLRRIQTSAPQSERDRAENSRYAVGLYGFGVNEAAFQRASKSLETDGYVIAQGGLLSYRPSWLSTRSVVLYYHQDTAARARALAKQLSSLTGVSFTVTRGGGLGVIQGQERWTFFIHYLGSKR